VLDIAATPSHTSVRPSTTAQRNIQLLEAEGRCQLLGVVRSHPPGHPWASSQDAVALRDTLEINRTWRPTL
jgi:proteasome lid subunit RPN8/RPN11